MVVNFFGGPSAAPIFITLLGIFIIYSSKSTAENLFKRGLKFLIGGYIFNILVFSVSDLIRYHNNNNVYYLQQAITEIFNIDILQFAALTFIFFAIIKKLKLNNKQVLLIGLCISLINLLTYQFNTGNLYIDAILGLFIQTGEFFCYFPFCTWIIYPIIGYIFGQYLIRCSNKDKLYKTLFIFSSMIFLLLISNDYFNNTHLFGKFIIDESSYYFQNFFDNIFVISFMGFWISIFYYLQKHIKSQSLNNTLNRWSKNVTSIYIFSYLLIMYLRIGLIFPSENVLYYFLMVIIIFILSDLISWFFAKYHNIIKL